MHAQQAILPAQTRKQIKQRKERKQRKETKQRKERRERKGSSRTNSWVSSVPRGGRGSAAEGCSVQVRSRPAFCTPHSIDRPARKHTASLIQWLDTQGARVGLVALDWYPQRLPRLSPPPKAIVQPYQRHARLDQLA